MTDRNNGWVDEFPLCSLYLFYSILLRKGFAGVNETRWMDNFLVWVYLGTLLFYTRNTLHGRLVSATAGGNILRWIGSEIVGGARKICRG